MIPRTCLSLGFMTLVLSLAPALSAEETKVAPVRKPFLEALNRLSVGELEGVVKNVPLLAAVKSIGEAAGVKVAVSEEVKQVLEEKDRRWKTLEDLRNRMRFDLKTYNWKAVHVKTILDEFARAYGMEFHIHPCAFLGAEAAVHPSTFEGLRRALRSKAVSFKRSDATAAWSVQRLGEAGGIGIELDAQVPASLKKRKIHLVTGSMSLWDGILLVAREFGLGVGYKGGKIILSKRPEPLPWSRVKGFWVTLSGEYAPEQALKIALSSCQPRLALRYQRGRWLVEQGGSPTLPWDQTELPLASIRLDGQTPLQVLQALAEENDLVLGFPGGHPTFMPEHRAGEGLPLTQYAYPVSFLKSTQGNFPGHFPQPGVTHGERMGPSFDEADSTEGSTQEMRRSLVEYVREMAQSGLGEDKTKVELRGARLSVRATPESQEKIAALLDGLYRNTSQTIKISFHFLHVDDEIMGRLIEGGGLSWATLSKEKRAVVKEGLGSGKIKSVKRAALTAFNGQVVNASAVKQKTYVCDYDVEVAQGAQIGDPVVASIREGMVAEVKPVLFRGSDLILLDVRTAVAKVLKPIETFKTPHGLISLPKVDFQRIGTSVFIRDGGTVLLGGSGSMGVGKNLVLMLQAKTVEDPHRLDFGVTRYLDHRLAVFDVRDLVHRIPSRPGPEVGITQDNQGGTPLMAQEDEEEGVSVDELENHIREHIAVETWDIPPNSITSVFGYLVVSNDKGVLKKVKAYLSERRRRKMKAVEVVTRFLSLKAGDLSRVIGSLDGEVGGGATLSPEQLGKLLALVSAGKGDILSSSTVSLMNRQRGSIQCGRTVPYIRDVDVEVAQQAAVSDPVTGHLLEGVFLDYLAAFDPGENAVTLEIRPTIGRLKNMVVSDIGREERRNKTTKDGDQGNGANRESDFKVQGRIMLPELEMQKIRTTLTLKSGKTALVFCPADAGEGSDNDLVMLVTVRTSAYKGKKKK